MAPEIFTISDEDTKIVDAHLSGCEECQKFYRYLTLRKLKDHTRSYADLLIEQAKKPQGGDPSKVQNSKSEKKKSNNSMEERLIKLKKLYEKGLISKDEYNNKKSEILDDL